MKGCRTYSKQGNMIYVIENGLRVLGTPLAYAEVELLDEEIISIRYGDNSLSFGIYDHSKVTEDGSSISISTNLLNRVWEWKMNSQAVSSEGGSNPTLVPLGSVAFRLCAEDTTNP